MTDSEGEREIKQVGSWVEHATDEDEDTTRDASEDERFPDDAEGSPHEAGRPSVSQVGERVRTLIAAAERAAAAIRDDAERQADEYMTEAQRRADSLTTDRIQLIANLTDDLIGHAAAVRSHSEQVVASLEQAIETITEGEQIELNPIAFPPALEAGEGESDVAEVTAYSNTWAQEEPEGNDDQKATRTKAETATLRATRLAIAGHDRTEIARTLRAEFGIDDPEPIIERVLGPA